LDYNNNKEEELNEDSDLIDPNDFPIVQTNPAQHGVCLFTDMVDWLKSDFEDDPVVDKKAKSTAAAAAEMIRKDKQQMMTTTTTTTMQQQTTTEVF